MGCRGEGTGQGRARQQVWGSPVEGVAVVSKHELQVLIRLPLNHQLHWSTEATQQAGNRLNLVMMTTPTAAAAAAASMQGRHTQSATAASRGGGSTTTTTTTTAVHTVMQRHASKIAGLFVKVNFNCFCF